MTVRIDVHPRFSLPYGTFVLVGAKQAEMSLRYQRLDVPEGSEIGWKALKLEIDGRRIAIYTDDFPGADPDLLAWSDTYFATNLRAEDLSLSAKLRPLGPVFGVTAWGRWSGYQRAVGAVLVGGEPRLMLAQSRFQRLARLSIDAYAVAPPSDGRYVFSKSRRWAPQHPEADPPRERFMAAMSRHDVAFDGGFSEERIPLVAYLEGIQRSALVFNSPAVHGCMGWKLGENLAMGKAIISTPLGRELPAPLVHGTHVHFVDDDEEAMSEAIGWVLSDDRYRRRLELGARAWYEEHLAPPVVARRIASND